MSSAKDFVKASFLRLFLDPCGSKKALTSTTKFQLITKHKRRIKYNIFAPKDMTSPKPIHFDLHGGGFIFGRPSHDNEFCKIMRSKCDCIVISLGYSKAPKHSFPVALEDVCDQIEYILKEHPHGLNIDLTKISVGGFSAGGNLAVTCFLMLAQNYDLPDANFVACVPSYPVLDFSIVRKEKLKRNPKPELNLPQKLGELFDRSYVPQHQCERKDPMVSPVYMTDEQSKSLPYNLIITTAQYDHLAHEGKQFADLMKGFGKQVDFWEVEGVKHGYTHMPSWLGEGADRKQTLKTFDYIFDKLTTIWESIGNETPLDQQNETKQLKKGPSISGKEQILKHFKDPLAMDKQNC